MIERVMRRVILSWCAWQVRRHLDLRVSGLEHVPRAGPVLIAARHFHHIYDGCILLTVVPRDLHLVVALDWVPSRPLRRLMERACRMAGWPYVLRPDGMHRGLRTAFRPEESGPILRRALRDMVTYLTEGEAVAMFPEAYPNVDPIGTPKIGDRAFLPFREGVAGVVEMAERRGTGKVPVVPAGLEYIRGRRWRVTLRLGEPLRLDTGESREAFIGRLERRVLELSGLLVPTPAEG